MENDKVILDLFGKLVVEKVFDNEYRFILNDINDLVQTEGYKALFCGMSKIQKQELEYYTRELLKGAIFDFLEIFDEYPQFKIIYEEGGKQVNINKISEMLKAELFIEDGWIQRFSTTGELKKAKYEK